MDERGPAREAAPAGQQVTSGTPDAQVRAKKSVEKTPATPGLEFSRYFTLPGVDPFSAYARSYAKSLIRLVMAGDNSSYIASALTGRAQYLVVLLLTKPIGRRTIGPSRSHPDDERPPSVASYQEVSPGAHHDI